MKTHLIVLAAVACGLAASALGNHHEHEKSAASSDQSSLFQNSFLGSFDYASDKLVSLAEALNDEQYQWRPAEGVRSAREVVLHVAAANYGIGAMLGKASPEGMDPWSFETEIQDRKKAIQTLKDSIEFARAAVKELPEDRYGEMTDFFGREMPLMSVVLIIGAHANEHLGQLIAYARSVDVAPPWSRQDA